MEYVNGEVRLPLAAYDLLKRGEVEWQKSNAELYELRMALGCKPSEIMPRINAMLSEEAGAHPDTKTRRIGQVILGMRAGFILTRLADGRFAASSSEPFQGIDDCDQWNCAKNPVTAMLGAGFEGGE